MFSGGAPDVNTPNPARGSISDVDANVVPAKEAESSKGREVAPWRWGRLSKQQAEFGMPVPSGSWHYNGPHPFTVAEVRPHALLTSTTRHVSTGIPLALYETRCEMID